MAKEPKTDFYKHIKKIVDLCKNYNNGVPLSVEVFSMNPDEMINQAKEIIKELDYDKLNIKVPVGFEELRVIKELSQQNVKVNCTCCFTATQMQLAALAGARYVSLFYNRLYDASGDPLKTLKRVRTFIDNNKHRTKINFFILNKFKLKRTHYEFIYFVLYFLSGSTHFETNIRLIPFNFFSVLKY